MNEIKKVYVKPFEALDKIDRKKWTNSHSGPEQIVMSLSKIRQRHLPRYGVSTAHDAWVVDVQAKHCSCGLCQLSGIFSKNTQARIYSHLLEPIRVPTFWPKLPTVLPPVMRVLLGRSKKCRTIDAHEKREKAEKVAAEREKTATRGGEIHFKNSRKGVVMHCKLCSAGHNKKTCPLNQPDGGAIEHLVNEQAGKNKKKGGTKRKAGTSMSQLVASNLGDGSSSTQPTHSQPPNTSRKSKKSM
ncbi:hypothetical protein LIER_17371 [Lithospermum erythrorhizon]|uniref:Uncharacterized protein n=1 Tax=Lithospermum erythrorhizon TaxID=34254 RepID=A0AAV3QFI0_LITER